MKIVWNAVKRAGNLRKHGVDFAAVEHLDWDSVIFVSDGRSRWRSASPRIGFHLLTLYAMVFTAAEEELRVIGLRKATGHEAWRYAKEIER